MVNIQEEMFVTYPLKTRNKLNLQLQIAPTARAIFRCEFKLFLNSSVALGHHIVF